MAVLLALLAASLLAPAQAQPFSQEKVITGPCLPCGPSLLQVLDVDGDGDQDIVAGSGGPEGTSIGWFENTTGGFAQYVRLKEGPPEEGEPRVTRSFTSADISGNGRPDLLAGTGWYENLGGGTFSSVKTVTGEVRTDEFTTAADLFGDNRADVVGRVNNNQAIWEAGTFGNTANGIDLETKVPSSSLFDRVVVADLNGDGKKDVLSAAGETLNFALGWNENLGDGEFEPQTLLDSGREFFFRSIQVADLDGDGDNDVLAPLGSQSARQTPIVWYENADSDSTFSDAKRIAPEMTGPSPDLLQTPNAQILDLDNDGDQDVVSLDGQDLVWFENDGNGTFKNRELLVEALEGGGGFAIGTLETGDLNGDGREDFLYPSRNGVKWRPNLKNGLLGAPRTLGRQLPISGISELKSADLNQDGQNDLLAETAGPEANLSWFESTGGGFTSPDSILSFPPSNTIIARVNSDPAPDLIYDLPATSTDSQFDRLLEWAENDGMGNFTRSQIGDPGIQEVQTTADVDGDGDQDLIATFGANNDIKVFQNEGGNLKGGNANTVTIDAPDDVDWLSAGDLDGDGDKDLFGRIGGAGGELIWYEDTGNDWVFASSGEDDFSNLKTIDTNTSFGNALDPGKAVDVDNDGDLDLISLKVQEDVKWYENVDGEGSFSDPKNQNFSNRAVSAPHEITDVDGDGDPDLLLFSEPTVSDQNATIIGKRNLLWSENQGGTFSSPEVLIRDFRFPEPTSGLDLSSDGVSDIVYFSGGLQKTAWFENEESEVVRRSMAAGETATFGRAGAEIRLSGGSGSGTVTVRAPFTGPVETGSISAPAVLEDRFVIEADTALTVGSGSEVRLDVSSLTGVRKPGEVTVYRRDTTDRGTLQALSTTYDAGADQIVATTGQFGEFVLGTGADKFPPDVPPGLQARASADSVALTWSAPDSADVQAYRLYRSTAPIDSAAGPAGLTALDTVSAGTTAYTDGAVQRDTAYHYRVTAVDDNLNESGFSREVRIAPYSVRVTSVRPRSGTPGTPIRIHGVGLALRDADVSATIGGDPAPIDSATTRTVYARIPDREGGLAEVSVTSDGATAVVSERFSVVTGGEADFAANAAALAGLREIGALDAADYDGDRNLDLALCGTDTTGTTTSGVYKNQGDGTFERANVGVPGDLSFCNLSWADYDGDGDPDLLTGGTLYENKDGGGFEAVETDLGSGTWVDVDKDGDLDLGASYLNDGDGTFTLVRSNGIRGSGSFAWADYDGDGDPDVALVGRDGSERLTAIYENKGDSTFVKIGAGLTDLDEGDVAWGDYDRDGDPDLVVAGESGSGKKTILYENKGGGSFEPVNADLVGVGRIVRTLSWGDFDGNGTLDLFLIGETGSGTSSTIVTRLYENRGGGTFEPSGTTFEGFTDDFISTISRGWTGDFNGDGDLDLILSGTDNNANQRALLFENGKPPARPTGLSTTVGTDSVALDWRAPAAMDVARYRVYRDTAAIDSMAGPASLAAYDSTAAGDTTYVDTDVRSDTTYHYRVTAVDNGSNESGFSEEVAVTAGLPNVAFADGREGVQYMPPSPRQYDDNNPVGRFALTANRSGTILSSLTVENAGTALSGIGSVELWSSTESRFDPAARFSQFRDSLLATDTTLTLSDPSLPVTFEDVGYTLPADSTYLFVVVDLPEEAGGDYAPVIQDEEDLTLTSGELASVNGTEDTTFTQAYLSASATALPVELAHFDAQVDENKVRLQWKTASETGNAGFKVQRSVAGTSAGEDESEGQSWTTVGSMEGAGTTTEPQSYNFVDEDLPFEADSLTYRLKQIDTDGSANYSEEITVERGVDRVQLLGTYPNPARRQAVVRYALPGKQKVTLRLYDVLGRQVRTVVHGKKEGRHKQRLDVSGLSSGVYFLRLRAEGEVRTQKLTVVR